MKKLFTYFWVLLMLCSCGKSLGGKTTVNCNNGDFYIIVHDSGWSYNLMRYEKNGQFNVLIDTVCIIQNGSTGKVNIDAEHDFIIRTSNNTYFKIRELGYRLRTTQKDAFLGGNKADCKNDYIYILNDKSYYQDGDPTGINDAVIDLYP